MSYKLVNVEELDNNFSDIANAIREKNGTENTYKPSEMPQAIRDIQSEPDPELVNDSYNLNQAKQILFNGNTNITDIRLDCKNLTNVGFRSCTNLRTLKLSNTGGITSFNYLVNGCLILESLEEIDFSGVTTSIGDSLFGTMSYLTRFIVVPNTLKVSANFSRAGGKLDVESVQSIIDGYADMTGQTSPVLTVPSAIKQRILDDDAKEDTDETKRKWLSTLTAKNVTLA